jgi:outer membrane protein assembly factor BamB
MKRLLPLLVTPFLLSPVSPQAHADDWPQWLGPQRDGVWRETGLLETFPEGGPKILWRAPVAGGYSGPSVADGKVYVMDYVRADGDPTPSAGNRNRLTGQERIVCLDAATGKELWKVAYDCTYDVSYPAGPRCTVTVQDGKAYALGTMGHFHCLDAATGKILWAKDFTKDYGAETPFWGYASHPLVTGNKVITLLGTKTGLAVAFDRDTGKELWRSLEAKEPGYAPATLTKAGGVDQLIVWHPEALSGLNPETGKPYWQIPVKPLYGMSIMMPLVHKDTVFAGGIMGVSSLIQLDANNPTATLAWEGKPNNSLGPKNSTPIVVDGLMYGFDRDGDLRCVDLSTGRRLWTTLDPVGGRSQNSSTAYLVKTESNFIIFNEMGELIIAKMDREGYSQISKAKVLEPTTPHANRKVNWSFPAFANKCVFIRNDEELICVSLAAN